MKKQLARLTQFAQAHAEMIMYFILIPFLHPRGLDAAWPWHKTLFTLWLLPAMAAIFALVLLDVAKRRQLGGPRIIAVMVYYGLFLVITLATQGGLSEGLQKLLGAPALYLFSLLCLRYDSRRFLRVTGNILFAVMLLNITVFCPPIMDGLSGLYHLNYLGHVQVCAMFGILGIVIAVVQIIMGEDRLHPILLAGVSVLSMLWSGTAASQLMLSVLFLGVLLWYIPKARRCLLLEQKTYLILYLILNVLLMVYSQIGVYEFFGKNLSISGRTHIWCEALQTIWERPLFGYGAYGVQVQPIWSNTATNYAHNELLQRLLDGGIVLCVCFYAMMYQFLRPIRSVKREAVRAFANTCIVSVLLLMIFESTTDYYYISIFLVLISQLPELTNPEGQEGRRLT